MDAPTAAVWIGLGLPSLGLLFKLIPQRGAGDKGLEKGTLKDADIDRLDARVKVYERIAVVESNQDHLSQGLDGLRQDNALLFSKIDDLKTLILRKETPHA